MTLRFEDATKGQQALGVALLDVVAASLQQGRDCDLDGNKLPRLFEVLERSTGLPDQVFESVAAEIDDRVKHERLAELPRYGELKMMIDAALVMHNEVEALRMMTELHSGKRKLITQPTRRRKLITRPTR
jgi:hypothetical protein